MHQPPNLFYHSDVADPYPIYSYWQQLKPLHRDEANAIWAVYSYNLCQQLLTHPAFEIPVSDLELMPGLSPLARTIKHYLARLSNPPVHQDARQLAQRLVLAMQPVDLSELMARLLHPTRQTGELDWVETIAKKLPVLSLLAGLGFSQTKADWLAGQVGTLTKLMLVPGSEREGQLISEVIDLLVSVVEQHIQDTPSLKALLNGNPHPEIASLMLISNLLGLLIQSYDAGRGLLTNALIQYADPIAQRFVAPVDTGYLRLLVEETLRFDAPIHTTRRVVIQDTTIGEACFRKGQMVLLVLGAANRDAHRFAHPHRFDPYRPTNSALLTFGVGFHACLARHMAVEQAVQALAYLRTHYPNLQVADEPATYERLANARLRQRLPIRLH